MNQKQKKLWKVQRQLADYSIPVYEGLAQQTDFMLLHTKSRASSEFNAGSGQEGPFYSFPSVHIASCRIPFFDPALGWTFLQLAAKNRPDKVILTGDTRYLSFWMILIAGRMLGSEIYIHGHALFKKTNASFLSRLILRLVYGTALRLCSGYIAYTANVKRSFSTFGLSDRKVAIAENSLTNAHPVLPEDKRAESNGILFCGRLREGNGLDLLIDTMDKLRTEQQLFIDLHIIGDGKDAPNIRQLASSRPWMKLYGKIYETEKIRDISLSCAVGCYPGTAGLSVVHYMSLSLVPLTHDNMPSHGPEAAYIEHGRNGWLFSYDQPTVSLKQSLKELYQRPEQISQLQSSAYDTYQRLIDPPLQERLLRAIGW